MSVSVTNIKLNQKNLPSVPIYKGSDTLCQEPGKETSIYIFFYYFTTCYGSQIYLVIWSETAPFMTLHLGIHSVISIWGSATLNHSMRECHGGFPGYPP